MPDPVKRYVALLRGINVSGNSAVKMDRLRAVFERLGFAGITTYIQSGNVLFATTETNLKKISLTIENELEAELGIKAMTFIFNRDELQQADAANPFKPERGEADRNSYLLFLSDMPQADRTTRLMAMQGEEYHFYVKDKVCYYAYLKIYAGNRRTIDFEKVLGVSGTARNWKVVNKLIELLA